MYHEHNINRRTENILAQLIHLFLLGNNHERVESMTKRIYDVLCDEAAPGAYSGGEGGGIASWLY